MPRERAARPEAPADWYRDFFEGLAADLWRAACSPARSGAEVALVIEALALEAGDEVLDLACGEGRLALPLAAAGYRPLGVDLSPAALARAAAAAEADGVTLRLHAGDLRDLPWPGRFRGAFCLGNSLGYQDAAATGAIFAATAACLKPGGRLLLHGANFAETLLPYLEPRVRLRRGGIEMRADNRYDPARRLLTTRYRFRRGEVTEERMALHHVFTLAEVEGLLRAAGLTPSARWSTPEGEPFEGEGEEVWMLAEKAG